MERDLRNPALVKETIDLISELRYEMKNILNVDAAFADGFKNYLMQLDFVNIQESDVDDIKLFIEQKPAIDCRLLDRGRSGEESSAMELRKKLVNKHPDDNK